MDKEKLRDMIRYLADEHGFLPSIIEKDYHLLTRQINI